MTAKSEAAPRRSTRREFVKTLSLGSGLIALRAQLARSVFSAEPGAGRWRAAILGHTGRGDYGHGLDLIFNGYPNIEVVAVADPDATGRERAAKKSKALRQYSDYREMLEKEKPGLVSIAPRATIQHHAMGMAAVRGGAHIFIEKPFTRTLAEADELLAGAESKNLKIAVAHQMGLAPSIQFLQRSIAEGLIGDLAEIRAYGKQDNRSGGEDMLVLGTHLFDLMRLFAGEPLWCSARALQGGREITRQDSRVATEEIGPVAADEVEAQFAFARGIQGSFTSRARLRQAAGPWGIELIGSKGTIRLLADVYPKIYLLNSSPWTDSGRTDEWTRLENDPGLAATPEERGFGQANRRVTDDWLAAIAQNREPICSGRDAMKALEMVMGIYQAALSRQRVVFPLTAREHPLK